MLTTLVFLPLFGALILLFIVRPSPKVKDLYNSLPSIYSSTLVRSTPSAKRKASEQSKEIKELSESASLSKVGEVNKTPHSRDENKDYTLNNGSNGSNLHKLGGGYDLYVRQIALLWSILTFILSTILWVNFDFNDTVYQYIDYWPTIAGLGGAKIGIDAFGLIFIMLTTYLMPIAILSTWDSVQHGIRSQLVCLLFIESILISVFISLDLICFYVSFEAVLIPLYLLVGSHGATNARLRASYLLFLYTLGGSLCMLLGLIRIIELNGTSDLNILSCSTNQLNPGSQQWIWLAIFLSLSIKAPLVPLHIWLPRAHAEAPLSTSIVLAGLVLKLSSYGYIRLLLNLLPDACVYYSPLVLTLSVITVIHGAMVTLRQIDSKAFVAMSSVSHMGIVLLGLGTGTIHGIQGAVLLSVAHGLVSPALFIIVGGILYDRFHTRTLRYYRGLGSSMPSFKIWFFLATCASMGVPGSLNWLSELLCLAGAFEVSPIAAILGTSSVFLGAVYSTWLYMNITGGQLAPSLALTPDMTKREKIMLMYLLIPVLLLGICPSFLLNPLHLAVSELII
jgi:NADH-ubiquinone oxidoreductase chain 4